VRRRYFDYHTSAHMLCTLDRCVLHLSEGLRAVMPLLITDKPITMLSDCRYLQTGRAKNLHQVPSLNLIWKRSRCSLAWACRCLFATFSSIASIVLAILMSSLSDQRCALYRNSTNTILRRSRSAHSSFLSRPSRDIFLNHKASCAY